MQAAKLRGEEPGCQGPPPKKPLLMAEQKANTLGLPRSTPQPKLQLQVQGAR